MRQLCYPVIQRYNPLSVETEADDFLVVFSSVSDAVRCAHEMIQTTKLYNKSVKDEKYQVLMGGLGVDWGRIGIFTHFLSFHFMCCIRWCPLLASSAFMVIKDNLIVK
jgi:hypothetical protein